MAWSSYRLRTELEKLELDQRALVAAFYSSGTGGDDLTKQIESLTDKFREYKSDLIRKYRGADAAEAAAAEEASEEFLTEKWW